MKITKILVALAFLFGVSTANAGEITVTGSMETTYHTGSEVTTGNPIGMDRELKFAGSTELDNGVTVSMFQDTSDSLAFGNTHLEFGNIAGMVTVYVGSDKDPIDAIDLAEISSKSELSSRFFDHMRTIFFFVKKLKIFKKNNNKLFLPI